MPIKRQNVRLLVMEPSEAHGPSLDELLGGPYARPGHLHEPINIDVATGLRAAAAKLGIGISLAVTVVAERALVLADVGDDLRAAAAVLDRVASDPSPRLPLTSVLADYARVLLAALHSQLPAAEIEETLVVPTRIADRLRANSQVALQVSALPSALAWELASVRAGFTMTEWAMRELLAASRYSARAVRQRAAAASTAR